MLTKAIDHLHFDKHIIYFLLTRLQRFLKNRKFA